MTINFQRFFSKISEDTGEEKTSSTCVIGRTHKKLCTHYLNSIFIKGIQRRMVKFFRIFEIIFYFVVGVCDLVQDIKAMYSLC